jgi:hypothetical protein
MNALVERIIESGVIFVICLGLFNMQPAWASEGNIDATYKYAWLENSGWENFRPTHGGVTVNDTMTRISPVTHGPRTSAG